MGSPERLQDQTLHKHKLETRKHVNSRSVSKSDDAWLFLHNKGGMLFVLLLWTPNCNANEVNSHVTDERQIKNSTSLIQTECRHIIVWVRKFGENYYGFRFPTLARKLLC